MRHNVRIYRHICASIIFFSLHLLWLIISVRWTSPGYFFSSYSILIVIAFLLLVKNMKIHVGALGYIFIGIFFGLLASIAACIISNAIFAPYRFCHFLNSPRTLFEFVKLVPFMSTVTGGWIAGGVQGYLLYRCGLFAHRSE